jgi:hypothetical protein
MEQIAKHKRVLIVEGANDEEFLPLFAEKMGVTWPTNLVTWRNVMDQDRRLAFAKVLSEIIPGVKMIFLRDRDQDDENTVDTNLADKNISDRHREANGSYFRKWRRRNIESYLIAPKTISDISGLPLTAVHQVLQTKVGVSFDGDYLSKEPPQTFLTIDGKKALKSIEREVQCDKHKIIKNLRTDEVCEDVQIFINQVLAMCKQ